MSNKIHKFSNYLIAAAIMSAGLNLKAQNDEIMSVNNSEETDTEKSNTLSNAFVTYNSFESDGPFYSLKPVKASGEFKLNIMREDNQQYGAGPEAIVKSLIFPGWGLASTSTNPGKNLYFALTPLSYGLIIYGFSSKASSEKTYKLYQASRDQYEMDNLYKKANLQRQAYLSAISAGVFIYVAQAGFTYIWGLYNNKYRERAVKWNENVAFNVMPYYDLQQKSLVLNTGVCFKINRNKKKLLY